MFEKILTGFTTLIFGVSSFFGLTTYPVSDSTSSPQVLQAQTSNDWYMPGANPQRTSSVVTGINPSSFKRVWYKEFGPYIPDKAQIIATGGRLYVSTSTGLYVLDTDGNELWYYPTTLPLGHSPTVIGDTLYVAGFDKIVHAIDATVDPSSLPTDPETGWKLHTTAKWRFSGAEAGFDTNPLAVNGKVFIGNRDGHMYALNATTGALLWKFKTGGAISYSAAYDASQNVIFFASNDSHAYALNADTGAPAVWPGGKSPKLPGDGFSAFWPVVSDNLVYFVGSANHEAKLNTIDIDAFPVKIEQNPHYLPDGTVWNDSLVTASGYPIDARCFTKYLGWSISDPNNLCASIPSHPDRRTVLTFNKTTGAEAPNPFLYWGTTSGNRYPPFISADGTVYIQSAFRYKYQSTGTRGWIFAWQPGTSNIKPITVDHDVADEPGATSVAGDYVYHTHHSDKGAMWYNTVTHAEGDLYRGTGTNSLHQSTPDYNLGWDKRNYGNGIVYEGQSGSHGYQNPPVPHNGKLFLHRSNSIIALGTTSVAAVKKPAVIQSSSTKATYQTKILDKQTLTTKLAEEVQKILDARTPGGQQAFLLPGYYKGNHGLSFRWEYGEWTKHYWHNPAETVVTLLDALPYLSASQQTAVRTYLQAFNTAYPFSQYTHTGWNGTDLVQREIFTLPADHLAFLRSEVGNKTGNPNGTWVGWGFNPYNFYAAWKWADEFGAAGSLLSSMCAKIEEPPLDDILQKHPHVHNTFIAGYTGVVGLQQMAPGTCSFDAQSRLNTLLAKKRQWVLDSTNPLQPLHPYKLHGAEVGGYLYLVPELGEYLFQNTASAVGQSVKLHSDIESPYWLFAKGENSTRVTDPDGPATFLTEGALSLFYDYSGTFLAKAFAQKASYSELASYLDVPAVYRGDLFYIQNLVATLEAPGTSPATPTPGGTTPTSTPATPLPTNTPVPTGTQSGAGITAGTGHATDSNTTTPNASAMVAEVVSETRTAYGTGKPKAILVTNNVGDWTNLVSSLQGTFGSDVLMVGTGNASTTYNAFTREAFVAHENKTIAALALGGSNITAVNAYQTGDLSKAPYNNSYQALGQDIGQNIINFVNPDQNTIIHLFGPGHYDDNNNLFIGLLSELHAQFGNPLPSNIKIIGAAAYITGGSMYAPPQADPATAFKGKTVTALVVNGTFSMATNGIGEGWSSQGDVADAKRLTGEIVTDLGSSPDVLWYIPGHPAPTISDLVQKQTVYNQVRSAVLSELSSTTDIFGHEGGGEYGHCKIGVSCGSDMKDGTPAFAGTTNGDAVSGAKHMFLLGIKGTSSLPAKPGDTNGDNQVNLVDLSTLLASFGTTGTGLSADFNRDGSVNLSDLSTLLSNFGT